MKQLIVRSDDFEMHFPKFFQYLRNKVENRAHDPAFEDFNKYDLRKIRNGKYFLVMKYDNSNFKVFGSNDGKKIKSFHLLNEPMTEYHARIISVLESYEVK